MAIDKHDRKTIAIEGITKTPGRPKGSSEPLTPAQKMRAYRERKAEKKIRSLEISYQERIMIYQALCLYSAPGEEAELKSQLLKRLEKL